VQRLPERNRLKSRSAVPLPDRSAASRRRGVTTVELLIVCGIVGILAAMVTTVALLVKGRSKASACGSNLGQIGRAMLAYVSDNDDRIPPYNTATQQATDAWINEMGAYGAKGVFRCPADPHFGTADKDYSGAPFLSTSYGVHNNVGAGYPAKGGGVTNFLYQVDDPSNWIYVEDKAMADHVDLGGGMWTPRFFGAHGLMSNAVCLDGRVVYGRIDHTDRKFGDH
jgi:type II secretory pathway pseudopilin PulG